MKKYINGLYVDFTAEEIAAMHAEQTKRALMEKSRPLTAEEVSRMVIAQQINTLTVDGNTALRMKQFYPTFESVVGQTVKQGFKLRYGDRLYETRQPEMNVQTHYPPGSGTESLYAEVCETHDGTLEDPIPYSGNMELEQGKYYTQEYEIYLCTVGTGQPVYHNLSELVGLYVEKV